ncbi:hypothetical protein B0A48_06798 [Cryoendolithus antarcticus]|uniref:Heme haloperoxidase family profile domain-containing protein n=1 Tax=Cryoendolithus antarcticus TaxID=1507870 RepID=A0A1V8T9D3_9PEZI|nr:hypothetical protein B0A48_06798 [Cryoendolithus antarcticus]
MKTSTAALSLALYAQGIYAFPRAMYDTAEHFAALQKRAGPQGGAPLPLVPPPFDPALQYVSNQGQYKFVPPGPLDERGPCPGLNALANHNYLPHNGIATIQQFVDATNKGFGMSRDLSTFLAVYGAIVDGTGTGWSIRGTPHTGISGSHGNYETDSSPCRGDLNQWGSNTDLQITQFKRLYALQPNAATANYNLDVLRTFRTQRLTESINKNPYFSYGPFTGVAVSQAAFTFIYRFMANKSSEYPEGRLDKATLKSFMSIQGDDNNLKWVPGNEQFPDYFYKRHPTDEYSIPYFQSDIVYFAQADPRILIPGCNKGKVNTYSALDPGTLSNGAYTAQQAAANPVCFASAFAKAEATAFTGLSTSQLAPLFSALDSATGGLNCKAIGSVNQTALAACPGFSFYGGPNGPVAPGAIQN